MRLKTLLCRSFVAFCFLVTFASYGQVSNATNTRIRHGFKKGFLNPTGTARPKVYWWWLNGYTDQARLKEELVAVKNAGLGGVDLFEIGVPPASDPNHIIPAGPAFMSDSSLKVIQFAINEAGIYKFRPAIYDQKLFAKKTADTFNTDFSETFSELMIQIWDPVTGEVNAVSVFEQRGKQMHLPLTLPPFGTYFVVFSEGTAKPHFTEITSRNTNPPLIAYAGNQLTFLDAGNHQLKTGKRAINLSNAPEKFEIKGEWNLSFPEKWGAPPTAVFPQLISWTDAEQKGIKYFSGIATYAKKFTFRMPEKGKRIYLDLGQVSEVAEVWLNDKPLGISWTLPHRFDITNIVVNGENSLRVEVANTWSNRLTGDAVTGEKFTKTNIVKANKNLTPLAEVPLKKSGLLGPVTIESIQTVQP